MKSSSSMPRGWTGSAAWKGAGASILLHLFVGGALIVALSGPPKAPPRVIDLTLLSPAEIGRRPAPTAHVATTEPAGSPGTAVSPGPSPAPEPAPLPASPIASSPPPLPSSPAAANPPDGTAQAKPSAPAASMSASAPGSPQSPARAAAATGRGPAGALPGIPSGTAGAGTAGPGTAGAGATGAGTTGAGTAAGNYVWIRDAIQRASAYPPTARRMGWEGKVVVAFRLLSDGTVRDVRVVQGSGHAVLDRGAVNAVRNASPFHRFPGEAEIITPVLFHLAPSP